MYHIVLLLLTWGVAVFGLNDNVYRPGDIVSVRCPLICGYHGDTIGMIVTNGLGQEYFQHDNNNTVLLYIQGVTQDMNGTEISCIARYPEGNCSSVFTLNVEGPPSAVSSLSMAMSENNTLDVDWTAPFTLWQNQNITYCVDLVNSASNSTLHSECGLVDTHYSATGLAVTCDPTEVVVTPVGEQGRGTESTTPLIPSTVFGSFSCKQNQDQCQCWLQIDEYSAPVCSVSATVMDDTGNKQKLEAEIVNQGKQVRLNFTMTAAAETYEVQLHVSNSDRVPTTFNFTLNKTSSINNVDAESTGSIHHDQSVSHGHNITAAACVTVFVLVSIMVLIAILLSYFLYHRRKRSHNLDHNTGQEDKKQKLVTEETPLKYSGSATRELPVDSEGDGTDSAHPKPFLEPQSPANNMESSSTTKEVLSPTTDKGKQVSILIEDTPCDVRTLDSHKEEPQPLPSPTECQSLEMEEHLQRVGLPPPMQETYENKIVQYNYFHQGVDINIH